MNDLVKREMKKTFTDIYASEIQETLGKGEDLDNVSGVCKFQHINSETKEHKAVDPNH